MVDIDSRNIDEASDTAPYSRSVMSTISHQFTVIGLPAKTSRWSQRRSKEHSRSFRDEPSGMELPIPGLQIHHPSKNLDLKSM
jgi:hypothetical protein